MPADKDADPLLLVLDLPVAEVPPLVEIRHWTRHALADLPDDELASVLLVCTELITNAHDHSSGATQLRLYRSVEPCFIRIEVDDPSLERPQLRQPPPDAGHGRGVLLIDRLCVDWGVIRRSEGKTVWGQVACQPRA
jgi:anti-sigma regulatory factor (Ser/Thr protein kinase)